MKILAFGDVHAPKFLSILIDSLKKTNTDSISLVLIAGDIVEKGNYPMCKPVVNALSRVKPGATIVAVFGNEDYPDVRDKLREECPEITWLDDNYINLDFDEKITIVGTTGVLDRPTRWQLRNIPDVRGQYNRRITRIEAMLNEIPHGRLTVLLTHYPPRCRTLVGEREEFWEEMSSAKLAEIIRRRPVNAVVHGHLHKSQVYRDFIGLTPVYNVALPAVGGVTTIEVKPVGLEGWFA
ncbi:MAG: metallophosphoesterase [Infirmifilum sp.]